MNNIESIGLALLAGIVMAGGFWALGVQFTPGMQLGYAYFTTVIVMAATFRFARDHKS